MGSDTSAPKSISVFKTARFSVVAPSGRKRAALNSAMRHAHVCFGKLLTQHLPTHTELEQLRSVSRADRTKYMSALLLRTAKSTTPWKQLGTAAKASIAREAVAAISSYVELKEVQAHAGAPSVAELGQFAPDHEKALQALVVCTDTAGETDLRNELLWQVRSGKARPLNFVKVRFSDGFLLLRNEETRRIYAWLNLFQANSRFAKPVSVAGLTNLQTGEVTSFTSRSGMLFPIELGHAYHLKTFIDRDDGQRPSPQSARLIYRPEEDRYELHVAVEHSGCRHGMLAGR